MRLLLLAATGVAFAIIPSTGAAATGPELWGQAGCGSCHTLQAAGSTGQVGPNLDFLRPSSGTVAAQVASGGGGMPSFSSSLSSGEIQTLAAWVSTVAGAGPSSAQAAPASGLAATVVRRIQRELRRLGYFKGPVTGFYGPLTTAAVKRFQRASRLHPDGVWGPKSAAAMKRRLG